MIIFFEISFKQLIYLAVKIIISFLHNIHEENLSKINRQIINARNYICMWEVFCGKIQNHEIREIICPKHLISLFYFYCDMLETYSALFNILWSIAYPVFIPLINESGFTSG